VDWSTGFPVGTTPPPVTCSSCAPGDVTALRKAMARTLLATEASSPWIHFGLEQDVPMEAPASTHRNGSANSANGATSPDQNGSYAVSPTVGYSTMAQIVVSLNESSRITGDDKHGTNSPAPIPNLFLSLARTSSAGRAVWRAAGHRWSRAAAEEYSALAADSARQCVNSARARPGTVLGGPGSSSADGYCCCPGTKSKCARERRRRQSIFGDAHKRTGRRWTPAITVPLTAENFLRDGTVDGRFGGFFLNIPDIFVWS
jgi:hypothetical protein